jgi:hypothetical protein
MDKKFNNIDDLLRSTLDSFEQKPDLSVWKKISSNLKEGNNFVFLSGKTLLFVAGLILLSALISLFNHPFRSNIPVESELTQTSSEIKSGGQEIMETEDSGTQNSIKNPDKNASVINSPDNNTSFALNNASNEELKEKTEAPAISNTVEENYSRDPENFNDLTGSDQGKYLLTGFYPTLVSKTFAKNQLHYYPSGFAPEFVSTRSYNTLFPGSAIHYPGMEDYVKKANIIYGFNLIPEYVFVDKGETFKCISAELSGRYRRNDFYLETGLGISISENDGTYHIGYDQYDSIGYYYKVTSFTISESSGKPVFNTGVEAVYDTVNYSLTEKTRNTYTYLYLPVYAGLRLYELKRVSLSLQAGIIYSVLINQNEPGSEYANENATRIIVTNESTSRISSNWIMSASFGMQYQLSNKLILNIEPMVKYYLKPVYESGFEQKSTVGIGLRAGLYIKF